MAFCTFCRNTRIEPGIPGPCVWCEDVTETPEVERLRDQLVKANRALTRIADRCAAFLEDERDMRAPSVEALHAIATRGLAST